MVNSDVVISVIFDLIALTCFIILVYSLLRQRVNHSGLVTMAVLFVFSALMGNPDRFQTMKFSLTGVETTARETIKQVQVTLDKLQKIEVAFAKANLSQLALSGQLLIGLNTEEKFAIRDKIIANLEETGVSGNDILDAQQIWIDIYAAMSLDHIDGKLEQITKDSNMAKDIDSLPMEPSRRLPSPEAIEQFVSSRSVNNAEVSDLIAEYKSMWTTGSMKNPSIIPFNENMRGRTATP
jgi:hypothetical protein